MGLMCKVVHTLATAIIKINTSCSYCGMIWASPVLPHVYTPHKTTIVQELQKKNQFHPQRQKHDKSSQYTLHIFSSKMSFFWFSILRIQKVLLFEGLCHSYWMLLGCLSAICWSVDIVVVALVIVLSIKADLILDMFARMPVWHCF